MIIEEYAKIHNVDIISVLDSILTASERIQSDYDFIQTMRDLGYINLIKGIMKYIYGDDQ